MSGSDRGHGVTCVTLDTDYDRKVIGQVTWHWYSEVHRLGIWDMEIPIMA